MNKVGLLLPLEMRGGSRWSRYVGDALLAIGYMVLLTEIFSFFHLYQSVPDSLLMYLLIILALAGTRGPFAALFASLVAFLSFDFLFVSPVYGLIATRFEDILALAVFLISSIMAGQLASTLRKWAAEARRREQETRILYDLVRATNHEEDTEHQLHVFARSVVEIFSGWGVRDCTLFLPDAQDKLAIRASIHQHIILPHEEAKTEQVMRNAHPVDLRDHLPEHSSFFGRLSQILQFRYSSKRSSKKYFVRLIPLKTNQKVLGVLRLLIEEGTRGGYEKNKLGLEYKQQAPEAVFFSTFLEQAITVIERGRMQSTSLHNKVLRQTDALRAALLSSVSHDLRTPLTSIKAAATTMLQKDIPMDEETRVQFTMAIEREADRLNRLVENLLDLSRIEGGALQAQKVWYPMDELIDSVLRRMRPMLERREVRIYIAADLPPVEMDYLQIGQVVTNLIENAHRYTPAESPIDIHVENQETEILVSIADHGPGIASSQRERIFDKFYRLYREPHAADNARGSGLGLAVCRGFIEAHQGRIWVEGREGGGAVFCFTLPLGRMDEERYE